MRAELAPLLGKRVQFVARFERFGKAVRNTRRRSFTTVTLLFRDIRHGGKMVSDHVWFKTCAAWQRLALMPGDVVEFTATVTTYLKGYRGDRDDWDLPPVSMDYKLARPADPFRHDKRDPGQLQLFA